MSAGFCRLVAALLIWSAASQLAKAAPVEIVGLGDSLMAGYELPEGDGFPAVLQEALKKRGHDVSIANAGVSGDTSSGGRDRLEWSVPPTAKIVILELGANDALRGIDPDITRSNLDAMIIALKARNVAVILAGMLAPPSMGKDYETAFNAIFPELAAKHGLPLIPFFLQGVAGNAALQIGDGLHPNRKGVGQMVENAMPVIEPVVAAAAKAAQ